MSDYLQLGRNAKFILGPEAQYGFNVRVNGLAGYGAVAAKYEKVPIPGRRGSFKPSVVLDDMSITITGFAMAKNRRQLHTLREQFFAIGNTGEVVMIIWQAGIRRWLRVQRSADVPTWDDWDTNGDDGEDVGAEFTLGLWAPDSRIFGEPHSFDGDQGVGVPVWHDGQYPAPLRHTVTGSMPNGYRIHVTGSRYVTITQPVAAGDSHTYDTRTGLLTVNDVVTFNKITRADHYDVQPGQTPSVFLEPTTSGTGHMRTVVYDTW